MRDAKPRAAITSVSSLRQPVNLSPTTTYCATPTALATYPDEILSSETPLASNRSLCMGHRNRSHYYRTTTVLRQSVLAVKNLRIYYTVARQYQGKLRGRSGSPGSEAIRQRRREEMKNISTCLAILIHRKKKKKSNLPLSSTNTSMLSGHH